MIEFYNVSLSIDQKQILSNLNFRIHKGEFVYLTGPSGSGKSTIMRLIYMDLLPQRGTVIVDKYSSSKLKKKQTPFLRRQLGVVFQDFKYLNDRNVFDNIAFALQVTGAKSSDIKRKVLRVMADVNLGQKRDKYPQELSGGEQQRVIIARAIVNSPQIVLADEPTGNLDWENTVELVRIFEKINQQGTAVFMATHNEEIIKMFPHRVIKIKNGELAEE
jgi:cell division transport system ATP-binding protein